MITDEKELLKKINDNENLIYHVLMNFFHIYKGHKEWEDLCSVGKIGLLKAIQNFDENLGFKFSTYAVPMIEGEIRRYYRDNKNEGIRFSRKLKSGSEKVVKYLATNGLSITHDNVKLAINTLEIDLGTGYSIEDVSSYLNPIIYYDAPINSDENNDTLMNEMIGDTDVGLGSIEDSETIQSSIDQATESFLIQRQKDIWIEWVYSIMYGDERISQQVLAKKYGCSQAQVSRIINQGKRILSKNLENLI